MTITVSGSTLTFSDSTTMTTAVVPTANVQTFTSSGTWYKPAGIKFIQVCVWGGGGGGGSGARTACGHATCVSHGGGGGGGGARNKNTFLASNLPSTVTVTVGAGGCGGTAPSAGSNGNVGNAGGVSQFGCSSNIYVQAFGGGGGAGGTITGRGGAVAATGGGGGGAASSGSNGLNTNSNGASGGSPRFYFGTPTTCNCFYNNIGFGGAASAIVYAGNAEWGGGAGSGNKYGSCARNAGSSLFGGGGGGAGAYYTCGITGGVARGGTSNSYTNGGGGNFCGTKCGSQTLNLSGQGGSGGFVNGCAPGNGGLYGGGGGGSGGRNTSATHAGGKGGCGAVIVYSW